MTEELTNVPVEEMDDEPTEDMAEEAPSAEDYAERIARFEEQFAELQGRLEQEKAERERVQEAFVESEKQRRLMHFSDVVGTFAVSDEPEQFAEDLYAVEQIDAELAERIINRYRAYSEAVEKGELFAQKSRAEEPTVGDPWLAHVERVRKEHFSDMPQATGFTAAWEKAFEEKPELARDYADRTRGG